MDPTIPSFFAGASNIVITGGHFNDVQGNLAIFDHSQHTTNVSSNCTYNNEENPRTISEQFDEDVLPGIGGPSGPHMSVNNGPIQPKDLDMQRNFEKLIKFTLSQTQPMVAKIGLQTQSFHSIILPNLQVSVYCALTTFESEISPWIHSSAWLNANVKHIRAIFDGIVDLTGNKTITFPATMIFQVC